MEVSEVRKMNRHVALRRDDPSGHLLRQKVCHTEHSEVSSIHANYLNTGFYLISIKLNNMPLKVEKFIHMK